MNGSIFLSRELYNERAPSQGYIGDGKPRKGVDQRAGVPRSPGPYEAGFERRSLIRIPR